MKSIGLGVRTYRWQRVLVMEVLSKKFSGIPRAGDGKKSLTSSILVYGRNRPEDHCPCLHHVRLFAG